MPSCDNENCLEFCLCFPVIIKTALNFASSCLYKIFKHVVVGLVCGTRNSCQCSKKLFDYIVMLTPATRAASCAM